jgi:hypothetical protein
MQALAFGLLDAWKPAPGQLEFTSDAVDETGG